jgi:hypothetical protein
MLKNLTKNVNGFEVKESISNEAAKSTQQSQVPSTGGNQLAPNGSTS